jgi:histidinol-phosphate aminotransferase
VLTDADLRRLLALPAGVVLDEAYVDFQGPGASRLAWVLEHDNLMVLRTFSKNAGLAGLRVGYGAFPLSLTPHLWKIKQPYSVSAAASTAALAALADPAYMAQTVAWLIAERERLAHALAEIPYLRPFPSRANFVLCRVMGRDARALKLALEGEGILVRHYASPGLHDCLRISAGKPEHTDALIQALRRL